MVIVDVRVLAHASYLPCSICISLLSVRLTSDGQEGGWPRLFVTAEPDDGFGNGWLYEFGTAVSVRCVLSGPHPDGSVSKR